MGQSRSNRFFHTQQVDRTPGAVQGGAPAQRSANPNATSPAPGPPATTGKTNSLGKSLVGIIGGTGKMQAGAAQGEAASNANAPQPSVTGGGSNRTPLISLSTVASLLLGSYGAGSGAGSGVAAGVAKAGASTVSGGVKAGSTAAAKASTAVSTAPTVVPKTTPNVKMTITPSDAASVKPISAPPISNKYGIQNYKTSPDGFGPQNSSSSPGFSRTGGVGSPSNYVPTKVAPSIGTKVANFGKGLGESALDAAGLDQGVRSAFKAGNYGEAAMGFGANTVGKQIGIDSDVMDAFKKGNYGEAAGRLAGNNIKNEHQVPAGSAPPLPQEGQRQRFLGTEGQSTRRYRPGGRFTR